MKIQNCFVVFGEDIAPQVHLLTETARKLLDDRLRVVDPHKAYALTFGQGIQVALPAWSEACMIEIAENYTGPHATQLKGLCAAIALGKPYGPDTEGRPTDGGDKVPRRPVKPKPSSPARQQLSEVQS
jgi:hypothetical protein